MDVLVGQQPSPPTPPPPHAPADFTTARNLLTTLADTLHNAGAAAEQRLLRQCVLDAETRHLGSDHRDTLAGRNNLATALNNLGRHQEAADLHQRTFADLERILGPDHPDTVASRGNLAAARAALARTQRRRLPWQRSRP
ncbi:tetratricopeptide repeat protein [Streptomyces niveus]|uniref:tetratricopeptide repeat protein n=1 Tax=Streptomyces niveus TaxID=193462 RepID=UPI00364B710E